MKSTGRTQNKTTTKSDINGVVLALQLLDTTWRVALPILLLSLLGHKLDQHLGTNPLFMIGGLLLSLAIATLLVYQQIRVAYPDFFHEGRS